MTTLRSALLLACASFAGLGCQSIIGADFDSAKAAPAVQEPSCKPFQPPTRPLDFPPAADTVSFTVVMHELDFGDELFDAGTKHAIGYDLDNLCTTAAGPPSCRQYKWLGSDIIVDGPEGRDDGVGGLFKAQRAILVSGSLIGSDEENESLNAGHAAPPGVLRILGYSGLAKDDHVVVELFQTAAFDADPALSKGTDGGAPRPQFDATDRWPLVRSTLATPDGGATLQTTQRDDDAFVVNNTLVAHFDNLELPINNVFVHVSNAVVTGEPSHTAKGWTLETGRLAARMDTKDLLRFIPLATYSTVKVALCKATDPLNYGQAKKALCAAADLPAEERNPNSPCAYISLGIGFETSPASLGALVDVVPPVIPCADADAEPDTCATD